MKIKEITGMDSFQANQYSSGDSVDPRSAMIATARASGLKVPDFLAQGVINRFPDAEDKVGKKSGWLWFNVFKGEYGEIYVARFGSWRWPDDAIQWCSAKPDNLSKDELRQLNDAMEASRSLADKARRDAAEETARESAATYDKLPQAEAHPYLERKGIKAPPGVRIDRDALVIPIYIDGKITSLQTIKPDGSKRFRVGGAIKGGSFVIPGDENIVICEGMATGATIHEATGFTVHVAFNAGNLSDVAIGIKDRPGRFIIAADDDRFTATGNTGIDKATAASGLTSAEVLMPSFSKTSKGTDFNDMAAEMGLDAVRAVFTGRLIPETVKQIIPKPVSDGIRKDNHPVPVGFIRDVYDYYMATSGFEQSGFALNTALSIASVICGRNFQTDEEPGNRSSLFFINVGNTSTGKEHVKTVIERVLKASDLPLIMGDGFTSAGAVFSALLTKPRFISVIDEMGLYLEAAKQKSLNQVEANSTLMQCFSRTHSTMRPKNYSAMTLGKKQKDEIENREVENPAVTLVGMTTPSTFFSAVSSSDIHSGFINRFVIHVSNLPIMPRRRTIQMDVPDSIIRWANAITKRGKDYGNIVEIASQEAKPITIPFSVPAREIQEAFAIEVAARQNELIPERLEALGGRTVEIAMRLSLCAALSRDPQTDIVADVDMLFAVNFMRKQFEELVNTVRRHMRSSENDVDMMDIVDAIRKFGQDGVSKAQLIKSGGVFRKHRPDHLDKILSGLVEAGMIFKTTASTGGRPMAVFSAYPPSFISG